MTSDHLTGIISLTRFGTSRKIKKLLNKVSESWLSIQYRITYSK